MIKQDRGPWFSVTASGTATAIATQAGIANAVFYVTDISGSTNGQAGTIVVLGGGSGTTALWTDYIGSSSSYQKFFTTPLVGSVGAAVKVQAFGSLVTYANISGFQLNTT